MNQDLLVHLLGQFRREERTYELDDYPEKRRRRFVGIMHIIVIGALFLYVGIRRTNIPKVFFPILLFLGIVIVLYHSYKSYLRSKEQKSYWINMLHILLVGPLLIYIGYYGVDTARMYFEILLMLGFSVIGYHLYYVAFTE
jgi:hypothetical protein